MAEFDLSNPKSRMEKILGKMSNTYTGALDKPTTKIEAYLNKVSDVMKDTTAGEKGEKGDPGPIGPQGLTGPKGDPGEAVTDVSELPINTITDSTEEFPVIAAGDKVKTAFGKIIKFFSDLKASVATHTTDITTLYSSVKKNSDDITLLNNDYISKENVKITNYFDLLKSDPTYINNYINNEQIVKLVEISGIKLVIINIAFKMKAINNGINADIIELPSQIRPLKNILFISYVNKESAFSFYSNNKIRLIYNKTISENAEADILACYVI